MDDGRRHALAVSVKTLSPESLVLWETMFAADTSARVVESNLIILCGSLPTLQVFVRHFRSSKDATSRYYSGGSKDKGGHALQTWGAGSKRQNDTIAQIERDVNSNNYNVGVAVGHPNSDNGSQEAILYTTTATVSYSQDRT
jgi:hypothetical protein